MKEELTTSRQKKNLFQNISNYKKTLKIINNKN